MVDVFVALMLYSEDEDSFLKKFFEYLHFFSYSSISITPNTFSGNAVVVVAVDREMGQGNGKWDSADKNRC